MSQSAIKYGKKMCDTIMAKFSPQAIEPNVGMFTYHHGVFLSGMLRIYHLTGEKKYFDYAKAWVDSMITPQGTILNEGGCDNWCSLSTLDYRQPGILLFDLFAETKDERYSRLISYLTESLKDYPTNSLGGFWHMDYQPFQMWLDSLYMASPLMAMYAKTFDKPEFFDMATKQAIVMFDNMTDPKTGLMRHGWDQSKQAGWADKQTGLSQMVWGRACGWFVVAVADILEFLPHDHDYYQKLIEIEKTALQALVKYQGTDGRWYQVVDKTDEADNWPENSCSCLCVYALANAVRKGYIDQIYRQHALKGYSGVIQSLTTDDDGNIYLGDICVGTCIDDGDYQHYINRKTGVNDLHGAGAFVLMCSEIAKL